MKKNKLLMGILAPFLALPSPIWAEEIWGYHISPIQAKFYLLILHIIAFSIFLVASIYLLFWILDLKKKAKKHKVLTKRLQPALVDLE